MAMALTDGARTCVRVGAPASGVGGEVTRPQKHTLHTRETRRESRESVHCGGYVGERRVRSPAEAWPEQSEIAES
jgi:hypothetical protein